MADRHSCNSLRFFWNLTNCRLQQKNPTTVDSWSTFKKKSRNSRFIVKSRLSTSRLDINHIRNMHVAIYYWCATQTMESSPGPFIFAVQYSVPFIHHITIHALAYATRIWQLTQKNGPHVTLVYTCLPFSSVYDSFSCQSKTQQWLQEVAMHFPTPDIDVIEPYITTTTIYEL